MSTALAEREVAAPLVTSEQLTLVKQTVAAGATDAELKLYLYDCARQGVHPLDRLIHFTKRGGKYTPITSIDFMRTRAADTGEYAGSDDAAFESDANHNSDIQPALARVTVWRLVQGQRCSFTATARWSEYCPASGQDHMWRKMPHTMLAKCAEALALRKGFPRQLAGLYAKEEMDQAGSTGYTVEAPAAAQPQAVVARSENASVPNAGDSGILTIRDVRKDATKNKNVNRYTVTLSTGEFASTIKEQLATLAAELCQLREPITWETKETKWGTELIALHRVAPVSSVMPDVQPPLTSEEIPF